MKVFINPGHDLKLETGAVGYDMKECEVTAKIGAKVEEYLHAVGIETQSMQSNDLKQVCDAANSSGADIFISIHCNASKDHTASGTETLIYKFGGKAEKLAAFVQVQITEALLTKDRWLKERPALAVLSDTVMPAIRVETAFIDNEHDAALLKDRADEFAAAIARGVTDYQQGATSIPNPTASCSCGQSDCDGQHGQPAQTDGAGMPRVDIVETGLDFTSLSTRGATDMIVIHHTGCNDIDASAEQIHGWHLGQGWSGIGYHFVIRKNGTVERGRPEWAIGSHAYGENSHTLGIHLSGDFEQAQPTQAQLESCAVLLANLCTDYGIPIDRDHIVGHGELMATSCPGTNLQALLDNGTLTGKANWYANR